MNNDDWQVGDLAVCVAGGKLPINTGNGPKPEQGSVYRVIGVGLFEFEVGKKIGLLLEGAPVNVNGRPIWAAHRFRKIKPDAEPCEAEFTALIKRGARKPVRV